MTLTISSARRLMDAVEKCQLADALGDSPETALAVHLLRKGGGEAYVAGDLPDPRAVLLEAYDVGPELLAFGADAEALVSMLAGIREWEAVNAPANIGPRLAALIADELCIPNHIVDDIYQVPGGPVEVVSHPDVRMLTHADVDMLNATPDDIRDSFDDDLHAVLGEELIAGAVVDGRIVSVGCTYGFHEKFVDVAISTLPEYRGRGYARAAASLVVSRTQAAGHVPIWSCAPTNTASLAVAQTLGFREWSRRANIWLGEA
jgi:ribosomal protein S18 acetylase RimI-like enzyme